MKTAVLDAGGGLRDIYAAGVLDWCLDHHVHMDICIGVSAGSANMASYVARQKGRNYAFYTEYTQRPEYMSLHNMIHKHSYIDLDYVYSTLSDTTGENPLDYKAIAKSDQQLYAVATNALTGYPVYFDKSWLDKNQYDIFKASCAIPVVCQPYRIKNIPFLDGALSDPIPLQIALDLGADKVVVILSKPQAHKRTPYKDTALSVFMEKYPKAASLLRHRFEAYNRTLARAKELEKQKKVLVVSPEDTGGVDTLTKDPQALHALYLKGYEDGQKIAAFLQDPPGKEGNLKSE